MTTHGTTAWLTLFEAAIVELDTARLPERIEDARRAIYQRLEELTDAHNGVATEHCEVLYGALTMLCAKSRFATRVHPDMEQAKQIRMNVLGRHNRPEVVVCLYEFDDRGFIQIDINEEGARVSSPFSSLEGQKRFYRVVREYLRKGYSQMPDHEAEGVIRGGFTAGEFTG